MFRAISLMAMTAVFLLISPSLRNWILGGYRQAGVTMDNNSPFSYIGLALTLAGLLVLFLYKATQPRRQ